MKKPGKQTAKFPNADLLRKMEAWWRAANYLSVGQTYLCDNPLLKQPLKKEHVKPRLVGHRGTTPGLDFIYVHPNRVLNVLNLMKLQPASEHPHGLSDHDFDTLFTKDKPIVFAFHGYPWLIHRLTYRRTNHKNLHVRGYKEEGTTTTPFDMCVLNEIDRFHLVQDVIDRLPQLGSRAAYAKQAIRDALLDHKNYITERGEDHPFALGWKWGEKGPIARRSSIEADNL